MKGTGISRRTMLHGSAAIGAGLLTQSGVAASEQTATSGASAPQKLKVAIFSKHLLFLRGSQLAEGAAAIGFDGIDLAVRKGGHVEPERVKQDLPGLVATIRQHGLGVPMLTTDIMDDQSPYAEDITSTMAELGIRHYRWGGFKYNDRQPLNQQIEMLKPRVAKLAALNGKYRVGAMFHTHSGINLVGASIWDLHEMLEGMDPALVGVNYDVGHATVEGGFGGWINSYRISGAYLRGIAVKDFIWEKDSHEKWRSAWKPLGEGMVRFPEFFQMVAASGFSGPLQLHFEYPLAGADAGKTDIGEHKDEVFAAMKRDLSRLRTYLQQAQLA